jgi:valyl-tRNA synthetase
VTSSTPLDPTPDLAAIETPCRQLWDQGGAYRFDPAALGTVFSVDTPSPYVSAAHLHVGHAMSYAQADFVVRFKRMRGERVFYPMGFDDNGLPTERYVERKYAIDKNTTGRDEFRQLFLAETGPARPATSACGAHWACRWTGRCGTRPSTSTAGARLSVRSSTSSYWRV